MRSAILSVMVLAAPAFADVPGPKPVCSAPAECVGCSISDTECSDGAVDAGLAKTDCHTQHGTPVYYYCPPGVKPVQTCGCSGGAGASVFALGALAWLVRRRRKSA